MPDTPESQLTKDMQPENEKATQRMNDLLAVSLLSDIKALNKTEQKKLQKYDNLYDRLRKKQNELEVLNSQRQFIVHFEAIKKASIKSVNNIISNVIDLEVESNGPLLEDQSVLEQITVDEEADAEKDMDEYHKLLEKFQKDFGDIIKVCEGYEAYSMFHYMLKIYLKEIVQLPPKMEEGDAKQVKINRLKIT